MKSVTAKLNSIRKEIRHRQLEEYFAMKRKLLLGEQMEVEQHSYRRVFSEMQEGRNMQGNLALLSGMSFSKLLRIQCKDDGEAEELYTELITFLINYMGGFRSNNIKDSTERIKCLNIILNLLADKQCPNTHLTPLICDFVAQFYESPGCWGFDKQLMEVGFLLANLCNNDRFVLQVCEGYIAFLLGWFQELLHVKNEKEMTESIYSALTKVVVGLLHRYNLTNSQLPELFQSQIFNILQVSIFNQDFISLESSNLIFRLYSFLDQLIPVLLMRCPIDWSQKIISNIFFLLGTNKIFVFNCLCRILKRILTLSSMLVEQRAISIRNDLRIMIVDKYMSKILIWLRSNDLESKEKIFEVVVRLIGCDRTNSPYILEKFIIEGGLENWMIRAFCIHDQELNLLFFELVAIANDLGLGQYFSNFLNRAEAAKNSAHFSQ